MRHHHFKRLREVGAMRHHHFKRLRQVGKGVTLYARGGAYPGLIRVRIRPVDRFSPNGEPLWRTVVLDAEGKVQEIWEADLWLLRKITVGYIPQMARYLGSARSFEFWRPVPGLAFKRETDYQQIPSGTVTGRMIEHDPGWRYIECDSQAGVLRSVPVKELLHDEVTGLDFSEIELRIAAALGKTEDMPRYLVLDVDAPGGPVDEIVKLMRDKGMSVDMVKVEQARAFINELINREG